MCAMLPVILNLPKRDNFKRKWSEECILKIKIMLTFQLTKQNGYSEYNWQIRQVLPYEQEYRLGRINEEHIDFITYLEKERKRLIKKEDQ